MAITLDGTTGITTPGLTNTGTETVVNLTTTGNTTLGDSSTDTSTVNGSLIVQSQNMTPYTGFKNRIINGAMVIDQRNAGASLSVANTGVYSLDRWRISNGVSTVTVQQSTTIVPTNFNDSLGITVSTTDSTSSHAIQQYIEGFNFADMSWGTVNAATITLSFWVRSSLTGTYGVGFQNSAQNRSYVATYTINSANTWEQKTITVAGDTSGTWIGATNGIGLSLEFDLGSSSSYNQTAGSWGTTANARRTSACVNWANTASATFYITGVQLEKGSTATSFDYRPYGTELALCQRYFTSFVGSVAFSQYGIAEAVGTTKIRWYMQMPVTMRSTPTLSVNGSGLVWAFDRIGTALSAFSLDYGSTQIQSISATTANVIIVGQAGSVNAGNYTNTSVTFSSEL